jgi:clathrin heavy chain
MSVSEKWGVVYMVTKAGYVYVIDCGTAEVLHRQRVTRDVLKSAPAGQNGGVIFVNKQGQVCNLVVNDTTMVPFVLGLNHLSNKQEIAFALARR